MARGGEAGLAMKTLAEAGQMVQAHFPPAVPVEQVPLGRARNRVLADGLVAPTDLPRFDNAAMDGFAVRWADLGAAGPRLLHVGQAAAGHPFAGTVRTAQTVRVLTGGEMPQGADTVVVQEHCLAKGDWVEVVENPRQGANVRRRGEDLRAGTVVLAAGRRLRAPDIALAAALGFCSLPVYRRLRVALLSTGDEVREPGSPLCAGEIWDANRWLLASLLEALGCRVSDLGIRPDDADAIESALAAAAQDHDLIVTSGGMSVGSEDHLAEVIRRHGSLETQTLAIKPGKPVGLGDIDDCPILALPGNPVAAAVAFVAFGRSLVLRLAGATHEDPVSFRLPSGFSYAKKPGRRDYLVGTHTRDGGGVGWLVPHAKQGSAMLSAMARAGGFIVIDEGVEKVKPGDLVDFIPYDVLMS